MLTPCTNIFIDLASFRHIFTIVGRTFLATQNKKLEDKLWNMEFELKLTVILITAATVTTD